MVECGVLQDRPSSERRCKQVLEAAEGCVRRLGFHNASMAEIAAAAGMSVGHIYRYFPNKEAIIIAIVEREAALILHDVEELERSAGCVRTVLLAHAHRVIERCAVPDRVALFLEVMAEAARNPRIAKVLHDHFGETTARMHALIRRKVGTQASAADIDRQMRTLDLILAGVAMESVKNPGFDRDALAGLAADCIAKMVEAEPAAVQ